jgi:transmembrane 9 superfamily member 2/4
MGKFFYPVTVLVERLSIPYQATRWDNYLHIFDPRIHWFSLINSLVIVVFLCAMVSMIVYRSVSRDVCPFISRVSFRLTINWYTDFSVQCN